MRHLPATALLFAATALALTGCTSAQPTAATPAAPPTTAASSPATSAPPATTPAPSASPTTTTATTTPTAAPATSTCQLAGLEVDYADDEGGGTAGSTYGTLIFTNTTSGPCTLTGFPGVSYVGRGNGTQIGAAAQRSDDNKLVVTLQAGQRARAQLRRGSPGPYGDDCTERKVDGLRVYPPASTKAAFVTFPTRGCANTSIRLLTISPVRS